MAGDRNTTMQASHPLRHRYYKCHKRRIVLPIMTSKLAPIILAVFALSVAATAQTWTFQGTQICYTLGSTVQCYARGTISSFVGQRNRAFESGRQAGQGVGSLAGVLVAAFLNHRQQVKIETDELTHASREHLDHHERLWWSLHGSEAQGQYICGAAGTASRPHQIAKGRHVDGLCSNAKAYWTISDHNRKPEFLVTL